tara:strand:- start:358 stop:534 length:177 start_codon:yes stop_codon:yes gene_type:complete
MFREILMTFLSLFVGLLSFVYFLDNIHPYVGLLYLAGLIASVVILSFGMMLLFQLDKR